MTLYINPEELKTRIHNKVFNMSECIFFFTGEITSGVCANLKAKCKLLVQKNCLLNRRIIYRHVHRQDFFILIMPAVDMLLWTLNWNKSYSYI